VAGRGRTSPASSAVSYAIVAREATASRRVSMTIEKPISAVKNNVDSFFTPATRRPKKPRRVRGFTFSSL
jgi:hypothetical protein